MTVVPPTRRKLPMSVPAPLVVRFGAFGDMVLLTPLLHMLHQRYAQPCTVVGSGGWLEPLLAGHPDVGAILRLRSRKRPYWLDGSQRALVARLRQHPPGPVYVCDDYALAKIRWLLKRARVPTSHCVFAGVDCRLRDGEHWIDRWQRFGAMTPSAFAGVSAAVNPTHAPTLCVTPTDRSDLVDWLISRRLDDAPLALVQPGNKRTLRRGRAGTLGDDKRWPLANWTGLIRSLLADRAGYKVVLCGAPPEAALLRTIAASIQSPRVYAAGDELPLRRLLALCERAALMVSVDTGPAQAAAALGCPLIVLYGAQPPSLWRPRSPTGSGVITLGGPPERNRVADIATGEVIRALSQLPGRNSGTAHAA